MNTGEREWEQQVPLYLEKLSPGNLTLASNCPPKVIMGHSVKPHQLAHTLLSCTEASCPTGHAAKKNNGSSESKNNSPCARRRAFRRSGRSHIWAIPWNAGSMATGK